jgi:hypothetical protein
MTSRPRGNPSAWLFVAFGIVLLSRLPFLGPGYGDDPDAWRLASASRLIAETGVYHESRSPGHPVQEWTCSRLWQGGPRAVNSATAVMSALAALFFGLAFAELGGGAWSALALLAFACVPVVYVHSVDAMDYVWAVCFSMAALWLVLRDRWLAAGVALGLAIGSRMTAGLLLFPLALLGWTRNGWNRRVGTMAGFAAATLAVGGLLYLPDLLQQGLRFLRFAEGPYPSAFHLLQDSTLEIWGAIGGLGLAAALVVGLLRRRGAPTLRDARGLAACALLAIALYAGAFLRLPADPAYLMPVVPFVLLLAGRVCGPRVFAAACVCLLLSPFFLDLGRPAPGEPRPREIALPSGHPVVILRPLEGPLLVDHRERVTGMEDGEGLLAAVAQAQKPAVVVCSSWLPQLEVQSWGKLPADARLTYFVRPGEADSLVRSGSRLYYVPGAEADNQYYEHVNLAAVGAHALPYEPHP